MEISEALPCPIEVGEDLGSSLQLGHCLAIATGFFVSGGELDERPGVEGIKGQRRLIFGDGLLELVTLIANISEAIMGMGMVRIKRRTRLMAPSSIPILLHFVIEAEGEMGFRQALVDSQSLDRCFLGLIEPGRGFVPASIDKKRIANGKAGVSQGVVRVQLQGLEVHVDGGSVSCSRVLIEKVPAAGVVVVGLDALSGNGRELNLSAAVRFNLRTSAILSETSSWILKTSSRLRS